MALPEDSLPDACLGHGRLGNTSLGRATLGRGSPEYTSLGSTTLGHSCTFLVPRADPLTCVLVHIRTS